MNTPLRRRIAILVTMIVVTGGSLLWVFRRLEDRALNLPDEKAAGVALLSSTMKGPRYFQGADTEAAKEEGGPWITPQEAEAQLPRVVAERKLDGAGARYLGRVIRKLTEPHPSRMVGGERIKLVRLNLALDTIRK